MDERTVDTARAEREARAEPAVLRDALAEPDRAGADAAELLELGDALVEVDREWRIVRVNANQEKLSRKPRAETLGRVLWEVWPETARPEGSYWREYHRCMAERVEVQFDAYFAPLDLWAGVTASPTSSGGIAVFFRDIGIRKRMECALRESEERFRTLADAMPQLVWTAEPDGTVDYYNCRESEFAGFERRPDGTWRWAPVLHPDDLARTVAAWQRALATGEMYEVEHRIQRAGGAYRWYLSRGVPVRDASGRIAKWYGTATDIEDQKRAQQALRDADARKTEFLAVLSHELRNPLAPIWNSIYVLDRADPASEQARRAREVIARQAAHLGRIVDDLLDVTRIARGKIELRRMRLDLSDVVRRSAEDHRPLMEERGIDLIVRVPPEPAWVEGDATRLSQILGNLLQNATRFTSPGGRIAVEVAQAGGAAELRVADTGAGIDPELLPRIFEPFTQGAQSAARAEGGLGLGLALVKGLAALHGGAVRAASAGRGKGAELVVSLPLAARTVAEPAAAAPVPSRSGGRRVLVVDDNADAADSLAEMLRFLGHTVDVAYDGATAVARARAQPPDAVLCDIGLPGMSGYDVARQLRTPATAHLRLIAVSGYAQPEDVERAVEAGFDHHVAKPPDPRRIESLLA